jgi:hypothetical protein
MMGSRAKAGDLSGLKLREPRALKGLPGARYSERMKWLAAALVLMTACTKTPPVDPAHVAEIDAWHAKRVERLRSPTGWLTLVGLFWLEEGENRFGSAADNDLAFPAGTPPRIGVFVRAGEDVRVRAEPGAALTTGGAKVAEMALASDATGEPTVLDLGTLSFFVIKRGDRIGVRVRDREHPARKSFAGIERFPVDPSWRVETRFEPYDPPKRIPVPNIIGGTFDEKCPGALVFEHGGAALRIDAVLEEGSDELFLIFGDLTNGLETYGAGRFIYTPLPKDGRVTVDFNKAYNPPCAFTPYATCPLPPPQNRLAARVEAGEKKYGGH